MEEKTAWLANDDACRGLNGVYSNYASAGMCLVQSENKEISLLPSEPFTTPRRPLQNCYRSKQILPHGMRKMSIKKLKFQWLLNNVDEATMVFTNPAIFPFLYPHFRPTIPFLACRLQWWSQDQGDVNTGTSTTHAPSNALILWAILRSDHAHIWQGCEDVKMINTKGKNIYVCERECAKLRDIEAM